MKLVIRILVLTHGFLTFSEGVNYNDLDIYKIKFVDEVYDKRPPGHVEFEVDENQVDTDKLSDAIRMSMCKTATKVVKKRNISVTLVGDEPEKKNSYFLSTSGSYTVQFVDAFKCPSQPEMYLQVILNGDGEETVNVILLSRNKNATSSFPFESVQYTLKIVTRMSRATENEIMLYGDEEDAADQNAFGEEGRFRMCQEAINKFSGEGIILRESTRVRRINFYKLYLGNKEGRTQFDFVQAFRCPSSPPTFLSVPKESHNGFKSWLIIEEQETFDTSASTKDSSDVLTPPLKTVFYKYELKPAKVIIDVTIGSSADANFTKVIRSAVNLNGLSEEKRRQMCLKAVGKVENDYRFVRYFPEEATGRSECYAVHSNIGDETVNIEIVEAFKCSTKPPILIHVNELKRDEGLVWVVIKDWKIDTTFERAVFNVNPVRSIEKATTGEIVRKLTYSREQSSMDSDDLTPDERHEICHRAMKNISGKEVKYLDVPPGMSKLYIIKMKEAAKETEKKGSDSNSEGELLRAFECPTEPAIFLEIALDWELEKCFVHILIKEKDLNAQCDNLCYQIKFVEKIVERSKFKGKILFDIPQTEVIDTDQLDEDARMGMCEKAVDINALRGKKFRFLPKTKTEQKKPYVLDLKGAGRRSIPELVDAFKCPVKPAVYLHVVLTEDKKKIVYVIFNDSEEEEVKFLEDEVTERSVEICRRALGLTPVENRQKGDGKHKYYLFSAEVAGTGVEKVSGKDVLRRFICPTKQSLNLEIHRNEEEDVSDDDYTPIARPAWKSRGLSRSKVREVNYKKKYVDRIIEAHSQNKFRKKTEREEFHEVERYEMCKDASRRVFRPPIELMKNKRVGKTKTYELHYETERIDYAQAFYCPTIPPIFLEVVEDEDEDSDLVWVILEQEYDDDDVDAPPEPHDDLEYEVKYITEIKKATSREITNFEKRRRSPMVDVANYAEEDRYQMCKEAAKKVPGRRVKFMELLAGETRYYNIRREDYETHRESDTFEMVMAFECPTIPQMHLQIEDNGQTVSIIVKRVPPIRDGIRAYRLKMVKSIGDVNEQEKQAYEVLSLLSPQDLEYDVQMRRRMCVRGMKIIPNTDGFLTWLENEDPGEEQFYAVEIRTDTSGTRQVLSAFECPTDPPFYLETFIDRNFRRSIRVIIDEERFDFALEYVE